MTRDQRDPSSLRLHEAVLLLALRDEKGTIERRAGMYSFALGGAILTELSLAERLRVGTDKKKLVDVLDGTTLHDPILDEALEKVATAKRRKPAARWVSSFSGLPRLRHRIADGLCRRGILHQTEDRVLLVFRRKAYPTVDPRPERVLVQRMRTAIFGESRETDTQTAILVTLGNATGLLGAHFDRRELKGRKERLERIARGDTIGGATAAAVRAAQQAAMVAVIAATSAASTAATAGH